mgnify:CR=1 FL=1|tara:strand:+ start:182 stop:826 length:645 start_codon:yes stop_codon:yes gene_type:complete
MKIHRVVQMLGATTSTGKLADDMYDLNYKTYYSEAEGRDIPISHMDFQHMVRAFVKLCEQEDMLDRSKHMGRVVDVIKSKDDYIRKLEEKIKDLESRDTLDYHHLHGKIEKLEGIIEEKEEMMDKLIILNASLERQKNYPEKALKGHYYSFCEIPNNAEGRDFIAKLREYLNKDSYKMRVRGQHLKEELYGQGKAYHGQSIEDSTHLRVYLDRK